MAPQTFLPHAGRANLDRLSPPRSAPHLHSLQHESSASPTLSHDIPRSYAEVSDTEVTPPTSSSGFSSQERPIFEVPSGSDPPSHSLSANAFYALPSQPTVLSPKNGQNLIPAVAPPKRTSSGQIKRSSTLGTVDRENNYRRALGHSRTSSSLSNGSSIIELSQQLRTRLSYAMVKVENGWESNTLEEIETLTSKHESPRISLAAKSLGSTGQTLRSPKKAMTPRLRRRGSSSLSSEGVSANGESSRVEYGAQGVSIQQPRTVDRSQRRALAPPADIIPGARRRPHHANAPANGYTSVSSLRNTGTNQRTPSQNAAMEADAVETLLFMASPGNTSHHPSTSEAMAASARMSAPTSSQTSPLRSNLSKRELVSPPHRHVAFTGLSENLPRPASISSQFDDIDRMIDEMDDASTDS